jgi:hypothetical protein
MSKLRLSVILETETGELYRFNGMTGKISNYQITAIHYSVAGLDWIKVSTLALVLTGSKSLKLVDKLTMDIVKAPLKPLTLTASRVF